MAIDWSLAGVSAKPYDAMESLRAAGMAATQRAQQEEAQRQQQVRQRVGSRVQAGDYTGATAEAVGSGDFDMARTIGGLADADRKRAASEAKLIAGVATQLRTMPQEQRGQALQRYAPMLIQNGFGAHELEAIDLSDDGVDGYISFAKAMLDETPAQDEPTIIRALDAIGLPRQSPEYQDIVKRSLAAPREQFVPDGMGGGRWTTPPDIAGPFTSGGQPQPAAAQPGELPPLPPGFQIEGGPTRTASGTFR